MERMPASQASMSVPRLRLLTRIDAADGLVVVEAGSGFGKSVLLGQVAERHPDAVYVPGRRTDGSSENLRRTVALEADRLGDESLAADLRDGADLVDALRSAGRGLVLDDADRYPNGVLDDVAEILAYCRPVVVASRARHGRPPIDADLTISAADLMLDRGEVGELLEGAGLDRSGIAGAVLSLTDGWPVVVTGIARRLASSVDADLELAELGRGQDASAPYLNACIDGLSEVHRRGLRILADVQSFDIATIAIAGGAGFAKALSVAGVPILERDDRWLTFPTRVRAQLLRSADASPLNDELLTHLVEQGAAMVAVNACLGRGDRGRAAHVISRLTLEDETRLNVDELNAAINVIGPAVAEAPRCLTVQAHTNAISSQADVGTLAIERAVAVFEDVDPGIASADHLEALVVLGMFRTFESSWGEAERLLELVEARVDVDKRDRLAAQLLDFRSLYLYARFGDRGLDRALSDGYEALAIWRELGEIRAATTASFRQVMLLEAVGRWADALVVLDSLPDISPMSLSTEAQLAIQRAIALPYVGRANDVPDVLHDVPRVAELLGLSWLTGLAAANAVIASSFCDEPVETAALAQSFFDNAHQIQDPVSTAINDGLVAMALARAGIVDIARQLFERMRTVAGVPEWLVALTDVALAARHGDPQSALKLLAELEQQAEVDRCEYWQLAFLAAVAQWRLQDADGARNSLAQARARASELGEVDLVAIVEWRALRDYWSGADPTPSPVNLGMRVNIFDRFEIFVAGEQRSLGTAKGALLLKQLVLADGQLQLDQVVDVLWPQVDLPVGRRRLRNVLSRVRELEPGLIDRSGDTIRLGAEVASDYTAAVRVARSALSGEPTLKGVVAAVHQIDKELLPEDRYDDWAEDARRDHAALVVRLLDVQSALADDAGQRALSLAALQRAEELDVVPGRRAAAIAALRAAAG